MAGSYPNDGDDGLVATINVTPLVDVMLVMMVIFMITAPMMQQGVEVNLPKATTAPVSTTGESVVISVDKAGKIFLGSGNSIDINVLDKKLTAIMERKPEEERKVYIQADTDVPYGAVIEVMSKIYGAGITNIGLVSDPLSTK